MVGITRNFRNFTRVFTPGSFMLKRLAAIVFLLALASAAFAQNSKKNQPNERSVNGEVTDAAGAPLKGAVVQLENTKTLQIRSFIAKDDGTYVFNGLNTDVDYQLSAQWSGKRSPTKTLSSFDSRPEVKINLQIKTQ
jgi:hypothetical protein